MDERKIPATQLPAEIIDGDGQLTCQIVVLSGDQLWRDNQGDFVIDLDSVAIHRDKLILDYNHNEDEVIGHIDEIKTDDGRLTATAHIYSVCAGDRAEEVMKRIRLGTPYEISPTVMFRNGDPEEIIEGNQAVINGRTVSGPATVFRNVPVRGASVCPYGTDKETGIVGLALERTDEHERNPNMADEEKKDECLNEEGAGEYTASPDLEKMIAEFGLEKGVEYFRKGISFEEAQQDDYAQLKAARLAAEEEKPEDAAVEPVSEPDPEKKTDEVSGLKAEIQKLRAEVSGLKANFKRGDDIPLSSRPAEKTAKPRSAISAYASKIVKNLND